MKSDLDRTHRLPKSSASNQHTSGVVVKFSNYNARQRVMSARRMLKSLNSIQSKASDAVPGSTARNGASLGTANRSPSNNPSKGIFISESLTPKRAKLMYKGRMLRRQGKLSQVWTSDGKVVIKDCKGNIRSAKSCNEIEHLFATL